jgi:hypothetical protein
VPATNTSWNAWNDTVQIADRLAYIAVYKSILLWSDLYTAHRIGEGSSRFQKVSDQYRELRVSTCHRPHASIDRNERSTLQFAGTCSPHDEYTEEAKKTGKTKKPLYKRVHCPPAHSSFHQHTTTDCTCSIPALPLWQTLVDCLHSSLITFAAL